MLRERTGLPLTVLISAANTHDSRLLLLPLGNAVRIAVKGVESSQRLGRHRWVVESCMSWLMRYRRLVRRYDRKAEHFQAFADLACYRRLVKTTN